LFRDTRGAIETKERKAPGPGAFLATLCASVATLDTLHHDRIAAPLASHDRLAAAELAANADTKAAMLPVAPAVPIAAGVADANVFTLGSKCHRKSAAGTFLMELFGI